MFLQQNQYQVMCRVHKHEPAQFFCISEFWDDQNRGCCIECSRFLQNADLIKIQDINDLTGADFLFELEESFRNIEKSYQQRIQKLITQCELEYNQLIGMDYQQIQQLGKTNRNMQYLFKERLRSLINYFQDDYAWRQIMPVIKVAQKQPSQIIQKAPFSLERAVINTETLSQSSYEFSQQNPDIMIKKFQDKLYSINQQIEEQKYFQGNILQQLENPLDTEKNEQLHQLRILFKRNVERILVVDRPPAIGQQETRDHGIIVLPDRDQGAYVLHLGPNQGNKNNFIIIAAPNYLQTDWVIREQYNIQQPVQIRRLFVEGSQNKNSLYDPQINNSKHAQDRIVTYVKSLKHSKLDVEYQ